MDSKLEKQDTESGNITVNATEQIEDEHRIKFQDWGFQVDRLFEVAYRFYKRNEGKAFELTFDARNQMNALMMQARCGNFDASKLPDLGTLDLVGKRRRQEWAQLNGMSKTEAMSKFICTLDEVCPLFKAHAEAVKLSTGTKQSYTNYPNICPPQDLLDNAEKSEQLQTIYHSLCRQTYNQFKNYAEQQFPNDVSKQKDLINTLQAQYYRQYISKMHPELSSKLPDHSDDHSLSSMSDSVTSSSLASPNRSEKHASCDDPQPSCPVDVVDNQQHATKTSESAPQLGDPLMVEINAANEELNSDVKITEDESRVQLNNYPENGVSQPTSAIKTNSPSVSVSMNSLEQQFEKSSLLEEPKRNYERVQPSHIGSFESFPKPRPIVKPSKPQRVCPEDPHLASSSSSAAKLPESQVEKVPTSSSQDAPVIKSLEKLSTPHLDLPPLNEIISPAGPTETEPQHFDAQQYQQQPREQHPQLSQPSPSFNGNFTEETTKQDWSCNPMCANENVVGTQSTQSLPEPWAQAGPTASPAQSEPIIYGPVEPATLWTKRGIHEFRDSLVDDQHGGEYLVKQGSRLIIQVPTYPNGNYIYWEFATDGFDIGFGVDFVHEPELEEPLAMQIFEDSDDEDEEEEFFDDEEAYYAAQQAAHSSANLDPELGLAPYGLAQPKTPSNITPDISSNSKRALCERKRAEKLQVLSRTLAIVPIYRRDSHEDVIVGRHRYPGKGYYRLKFDNTYSVFRSKTLFFRVCFFT